MIGILFWLSLGLRGSCWRTVVADDCNILVYWYGRTYSISHRLYKNKHFVQSLSCIWLSATPWTAAHQASLSFTISWSFLKLMSNELVMLSNHLSLCLSLRFCLQSFSASGSFLMDHHYTSGGKSIGASASASVLPTNNQDWFPLGLTGWISLQSKGLSRVFSNTTVQKHQYFSAQLSL